MSIIGPHYTTPSPPSTNGTHFCHVSREVLRDERWLSGHHHLRNAARGRIPLRAYLTGAVALVVFWAGLAILLGWRPVAW